MSTKRKFDSLTKAEQRVVIAKDLIKRLNAKEFIAESGTYLKSHDVYLSSLEADETQVRDALNKALCQGCQIGGLFLCAVDRYNRLTLRDVGGDLQNREGMMRRYLNKWFPESVLTELESAFEGFGKYSDFRYAYEDDTKRMRLIAKNIIQNKGRFVGGQLLAN